MDWCNFGPPRSQGRQPLQWMCRTYCFKVWRSTSWSWDTFAIWVRLCFPERELPLSYLRENQRSTHRSSLKCSKVRAWVKCGLEMGLTGDSSGIAAIDTSGSKWLSLKSLLLSTWSCCTFWQCKRLSAVSEADFLKKSKSAWMKKNGILSQSSNVIFGFTCSLDNTLVFILWSPFFCWTMKLHSASRMRRRIKQSDGPWICWEPSKSSIIAMHYAFVVKEIRAEVLQGIDNGKAFSFLGGVVSRYGD